MRVMTVAAAMLLCWQVQAQTPAGEIRIDVKDPSGPTVQAKVKVDGAGVSRTAETDAQGHAAVSNLPFGRYHVEIAKQGFSAQSLTLDVESANPVSKAVGLVLASVSEKVEVVAATPLAGTDIPLEQIPAPVQTLTSHAIEES